MDAALRRQVRERAGNQCEYCRIRQDADPLYRFHIEHITPRQHGGADESENLTLACHYCNVHKGPNLSGLDPLTSEITTLFHPRRHVWTEHFRQRGNIIEGLIPVGRATVHLLRMNAIARVELR